MVVAALGDPEISIPGRRGQDPGPALVCGVDIAQVAGPQALVHDLVNGRGDLAVTAGAQNAVHLGQLPQHILLVPLGHAAGDQDLFHLAGLFQLRHFQNVVDGLLTGRGQEAAGVHHHHIRPLRGADDGVARRLNGGHHLLTVHLVLGAAQGNKRNLIGHGGSSF